MELSLRRWKPGQLLVSWGVYWTGLIGATMGPAIRATWRATNLPDGHGSINASMNNGTLTYIVIEDGVKTLVNTAQFSTTMLWLVGPPLALWLLWLLVRERPSARRAAMANGAADQLAAGSGPAPEWRVNAEGRAPIERERIRTPDP